MLKTNGACHKLTYLQFSLKWIDIIWKEIRGCLLYSPKTNMENKHLSRVQNALVGIAISGGLTYRFSFVKTQVILLSISSVKFICVNRIYVHAILYWVWNIVINIQGRFLHPFQYNTTDLIKQITPWRLIWMKYYKVLNKYIYRPNISIKKTLLWSMLW